MKSSSFSTAYDVLRSSDLDCIAFVPGSNFRKLLGQDFHLIERPLVIILQAEGRPIAIIPSLEMDSFENTGFEGDIFSWRDEKGYAEAFQLAAAAAPHLKKAKRFGLEAQRMRVFEQMALAEAFPNAQFVDAHAEFSTIRLR
ncbi:MAG: aminopeptidase P family N-terminal domain-containing protein, partial [Pseudomonadota bacterium]